MLKKPPTPAQMETMRQAHMDRRWQDVAKTLKIRKGPDQQKLAYFAGGAYLRSAAGDELSLASRITSAQWLLDRKWPVHSSIVVELELQVS